MSTRSRLSHPYPWKVRFASLLLVAAFWIGLGTAGVFAAGMILNDDALLRATVIGAVGFAASTVGALLIGHRLNCSVCANPVFVVRGCRKHGRARKFLGFSYRLGIATESLLRKRFHCMYCGERIPLQKPDRFESAAIPAEPLEELTFTAAGELPPRRR